MHPALASGARTGAGWRHAGCTLPGHYSGDQAGWYHTGTPARARLHHSHTPVISKSLACSGLARTHCCWAGTGSWLAAGAAVALGHGSAGSELFFLYNAPARSAAAAPTVGHGWARAKAALGSAAAHPDRGVHKRWLEACLTAACQVTSWRPGRNRRAQHPARQHFLPPSCSHHHPEHICKCCERRCRAEAGGGRGKRCRHSRPLTDGATALAA